MQKRFLLRWPRPSLPFAFLVLFFITLLAAGGASRADVFGQVVVRTAAWGLLVAAFFVIKSEQVSALRQARPVAVFLAAAVFLTILQLVPLPPALWQALPGRTLLAEAARASGQPQPWRPWAIVPGAAANALSSLVVPLVVLVLIVGIGQDGLRQLPGLLLALITVSMLIGLAQVSGTTLTNPLVNNVAGDIGGTFANRNHFALFLALGCLIAPVWAFVRCDQTRMRTLVAFGLILLFILTILASGSRAGLLLGLLAVLMGLVLTRQGIKQTMSHYPRWVLPTVLGGVVTIIIVFVVISVAADRAVAIDRALAVDLGHDVRSSAMPTVLAMIRTYFPMGSGLGGFVPVFQIHEPFKLLRVTYLNNAHNDFLEIVLETGVPGVLLMIAAIGWWARASVCAWRLNVEETNALPKLGSAVLLLVFIASMFDYPARTPMILAIIIVAGVWLGESTEERLGPALLDATHTV